MIVYLAKLFIVLSYVTTDKTWQKHVNQLNCGLDSPGVSLHPVAKVRVQPWNMWKMLKFIWAYAD